MLLHMLESDLLLSNCLKQSILSRRSQLTIESTSTHNNANIPLEPQIPVRAPDAAPLG